MNALQILARVMDRPTQAMIGAVERPRSWFLPALLLVLGLSIRAWFTAPYNIEIANERATQMIERVTVDMPEESARLVRERAQEVTLSHYLLTRVGFGIIGLAMGWVVMGALVHFSSMAAGGTSTWPSTYSACVWAMLPFFVRDILMTIWTLASAKVPGHEGLSFLVQSGDWFQDTRSPSYAALGHMDPFAVWHIILLVIAIRASTRLSRGGSAFLALAVWAIFLGIKLIPVLISQTLGSRFAG